MTLLVLIVLLACAAAIAMYVGMRGHHRRFEKIEDIEGALSPIDLNSFARLTDIRERRFLKSSLPANVYRRVQRERVLIAIQYVKSAARNAAVIIRVAETQSSDVNLDVRARAKRLTEESFRLRLVCIFAIAMLYISFVFPDHEISILDLISRYESMSDSLSRLSMLSNPLLASRVRMWL